MDWTLFAGVNTGLADGVDGVMPYVVGAFVILASIGVAFRLFGKAGVRR